MRSGSNGRLDEEAGNTIIQRRCCPELYFEINQIMDYWKVVLTAVCMERKVVDWFQWGETRTKGILSSLSKELCWVNSKTL